MKNLTRDELMDMAQHVLDFLKPEQLTVGQVKEILRVANILVEQTVIH